MKLEWSTEKRKVNDLLPYVNNPRILTEEKKEQLKRSIEKFNLVEIPAINTDNTLLAGHQRVKVLQLLGRGEEEIDVRVPNRLLNLKEIKEYNITSNVQVGMWDIDMLESVFTDIDLASIGINLEELKMPETLATIPETPTNKTEIEEDDYDIPEEIKVDVVLGDLIEIGPHRLLCGDSTDADCVTKLMGGVFLI